MAGVTPVHTNIRVQPLGGTDGRLGLVAIRTGSGHPHDDSLTLVRESVVRGGLAQESAVTISLDRAFGSSAFVNGCGRHHSAQRVSDLLATRVSLGVKPDAFPDAHLHKVA